MAFNSLLWKHVCEGKTSFKEEGKEVVLRPSGDECVLVFQIDSDVFRQRHGLIGQAVCDVLIFAKRKGALPKLVFLELKSGDYKKAVNQIKSVIPKIKEEIAKEGLKATFYAVVLLSDPVPGGTEEKRLVRELNALGVTLKFKGGVRKGHPPVELRNFIE